MARSTSSAEGGWEDWFDGRGLLHDSKGVVIHSAVFKVFKVKCVLHWTMFLSQIVCMQCPLSISAGGRVLAQDALHAVDVAGPSRSADRHHDGVSRAASSQCCEIGWQLWGGMQYSKEGNLLWSQLNFYVLHELWCNQFCFVPFLGGLSMHKRSRGFY